MSLAHRIKELENARTLPEDHPDRASEIARLEKEIREITDAAGVPVGAKIREVPKGPQRVFNKPRDRSKASKVRKPTM